jgi:hypothetical protein
VSVDACSSAPATRSASTIFGFASQIFSPPNSGKSGA